MRATHLPLLLGGLGLALGAAAVIAARRQRKAAREGARPKSTAEALRDIEKSLGQRVQRTAARSRGRPIDYTGLADALGRRIDMSIAAANPASCLTSAGDA